MNISQFNSIIHTCELREFSSLRSAKDPGSLNTMWKIINELADIINKHTRDVGQLNREFKQLESRNILSFDLYPFKIYTLPNEFRGDLVTDDINWRTVRVRGGYVLTQQVSTSSFVNGCDGMQLYPYLSTFPLTSSVDITVDNNSLWWFWIENISSSYQLRYAPNPTVTGSGNPNPWTGFPTADSQHIPIGYVDTTTSSSINQILVRQFINADIVAQGGTGQYQLWNYTSSFSKGTTIWVEPSASYPIPWSVPASSSTPPLAAGAFFVDIDVPASGSSRNSYNLYYPFYPTWPDSATTTVSGSPANQIFFRPITPLSPQTFCTPNGDTLSGFGLFIPTGSGYDYSLPYNP